MLLSQEGERDWALGVVFDMFSSNSDMFVSVWYEIEIAESRGRRTNHSLLATGATKQ